MLLGVPTVSGGSKWRVRPASKQFWEAQGCARVLESCREQWGKKRTLEKSVQGVWSHSEVQRQVGRDECESAIHEREIEVLFSQSRAVDIF